MASKHLRTISACLAVPELQMSSTLRFHLISAVVALTYRRDRKDLQARGQEECRKMLGSAHDVAFVHTHLQQQEDLKNKTSQ